MQTQRKQVLCLGCLESSELLVPFKPPRADTWGCVILTCKAFCYCMHSHETHTHTHTNTHTRTHTHTHTHKYTHTHARTHTHTQHTHTHAHTHTHTYTQHTQHTRTHTHTHTHAHTHTHTRTHTTHTTHTHTTHTQHTHTHKHTHHLCKHHAAPSSLIDNSTNLLADLDEPDPVSSPSATQAPSQVGALHHDLSWPEPYMYTVYDSMFGDTPTKNTVYTPYIYGSDPNLVVT